jgi:hypothetical protein
MVRTGLLAVLLLAYAAAPAFADPPTVPRLMQAEINRAIDQGVLYLRHAQGPWGSWIDAKNAHKVAYAALPGLTLLECGVAKEDPQVQGAATFVRFHSGDLQQTYDLSLAVLFLDRLGDPRDRKLIQVLALRLVSGQTATGGWSYKCPLVPIRDHDELFALLKKLSPQNPFDPMLALDPKGTGLPTAISGPGSELPKGVGPGGKPGERTDPATLGSSAGGKDNPLAAPGSSQQAGPARPLSRPPGGALCIKMLDDPGPPAAAAEQSADKKTPPKKIPIPPRFRGLPVLQDPARQALVDPPDRTDQPLWGTTDNSNTQFAILALWAARRHGVALERSFHLMVRRFATSQNQDGSWGYRYRFGGGEGGSPAMNCVGLLGLAVGHGLAHDARAQDPAAEGARQLGKDPKVVNGFLALDRHVGQPTGQWRNLPMNNLYFLWSVERVGVLYNLPTIGRKEWYRWGAEILLANQRPQGNWEKGAYHGADATIDTCLALLFLKRANLARDLTDRLPFRPDDLNKDIISKLPVAIPTEKSPPEPAKEEKQAEVPPIPPIILPTGIPPEKEGDADPRPSGGPTSRPPVARSSPAEEQGKEEGGSMVWGLIVIVLALLLLAAGIAFLVWSRRGGEEESEARPRKGPKKKTAVGRQSGDDRSPIKRPARR